MEHRNETIRKQRVELDGNSFRGCQFIECTLSYSGGELPHLIECLFQGNRWELAGAAAETVEFMRGIYHGAGEGGMRLIEECFNQIRTRP